MINMLAAIPARALFARLFSLVFFLLAFTLVSATVMEVVSHLQSGEQLMQALIKGVNGSIIALAVYELAMVIRSEYSGRSESHDVITMMRRTLPRFIGTVCVAMSLEGLIMIIKYSQLDLAGNLYYPVAIIISTAFLLAALGVFMKMAPSEQKKPCE
jgi:magnesium-transporting ATPase (P-type)